MGRLFCPPHQHLTSISECRQLSSSSSVNKSTMLQTYSFSTNKSRGYLHCWSCHVNANLTNGTPMQIHKFLLSFPYIFGTRMQPNSHVTREIHVPVYMKEFNLQHVGLSHVEIAMEVCICCMMIEPCFNFLNALAASNEFPRVIRIYQHQNMKQLPACQRLKQNTLHNAPNCIRPIVFFNGPVTEFCLSRQP